MKFLNENFESMNQNPDFDNKRMTAFKKYIPAKGILQKIDSRL